jgi:hypothetical protein
MAPDDSRQENFMNLFAATTLIALATTLAAAPVLAQDVYYELVNSSSYTIDQFYTSSASDPSWGNDLMAGLDLYPGEVGTVTIADGGSECVYDTLMVMASGEEVSNQVDVCQVNSYTLYD